MTPHTFPVRNAFEKVLGKELMAYILHLRPLEWPIMTGHFLFGTLLAVGWPLPVKSSLMGWFIFVVLLNGGTLAINSAFDKDEGDIGYLRQPPKPPKYLLHFSIVLLTAGLLWSAIYIPIRPAGRYFFEIVMTCTLMSVLYSVPPIRLKARAGWDLLINCVGFGLFTPLAGWSLTGRAFTPAIWTASIGFCILFAVLYPMTQIYQVEEDTERGDRTLVIRMGVARSLNYAILACVVAHLWFAYAVIQSHRNPAAILLSLVAWLGVLIPWRMQWRKWSDKQHEAGMYRGLAAWAITDISLLILMWP
jgi:lycopene elongase/hydratase (dihydrobisanhydrobacterioruberin-forming)